MALEDSLTPEEQSQMDAMRAADQLPVDGAETPAPAGADGQPVVVEPTAPPQQGMVPHAALHEERERRKQVEQAMVEERRLRALTEERTNLLLQSLARGGVPQQPAVQEIPTLDKDPVGYLVGTLQRQGEVIQALTQNEMQRNQFVQQSSGVMNLQQHAIAQEREFAAQNPDYQSALDHLMKARHADLVEVGCDAAERQQILTQEALAIAERGMRTNRNPAEIIYKLAQQRGYKKAAEAALPDVGVAPGAEATARIVNAAAAQQQNRSLSNARGSAQVPLTAQRLAEMPEAEFAKMIGTPEGRALLG
jgi:hypothetical protein